MESSACTLRPRSAREGFALASALLALVIVGALVTGGFYAANQESATARSTRNADEAVYIAEQGINRVIGTQTVAYLNSLADGTVAGPDTGYVTAGADTIGVYSYTIRKLANRLALVTSKGVAMAGGRPLKATHSLATVVRTVYVGFPMNRAVQTYGSLDLGGNATISGADTFPNNWNGCSSAGTKSSIVAKDSTLITDKGSSTITGPISQDSSMAASDFFGYGDVNYTDLANMATIVLAGGTTITTTGPALDASGACDHSVKTNWGAPTDSTNACYMYWPIIHATGDLHISSSTSGQGVLLVDGDLDMSGGFNFYGVVIVTGSLTTSGTGAHIYGSALLYSGGVLSETSTAIGNSVVNYSSCAIKRAQDNLTGVARPVPLTTRSWFDLSAIGAT